LNRKWFGRPACIRGICARDYFLKIEGYRKKKYKKEKNGFKWILKIAN